MCILLFLLTAFSQGVQGFYFTSVHPDWHPLTYTMGNIFDYNSIHDGTPQVVSHSFRQIICDPQLITTIAFAQQSLNFHQFCILQILKAKILTISHWKKNNAFITTTILQQNPYHVIRKSLIQCTATTIYIGA